MPKVGRRLETQTDSMFEEVQVTRNAPFGTLDTPSQRVKIIGGKAVFVKEAITGKSNGDGPSSSAASYSLPRNGQAERGHFTPRNLAPMAGEANQFNPLTLPPKAETGSLNIFKTDRGFGRNAELNRPMNPHRVVPPIGSTDNSPTRVGILPGMNNAHLPPFGSLSHRSQNGVSETQATPRDGPSPSQNGLNRINLTKYLPARTLLASQPISLTASEEMELRRRVCRELSNFEGHNLKNIYMDLIKYDESLSGIVNFSDLGLVFLRHQAVLSAPVLRICGSMYVVPNKPESVDYEKLLSFLAACLRSGAGASPRNSPRETEDTVSDAREILTPMSHDSQPLSNYEEAPSRAGLSFNPITHAVEDPRARKGNENAKLLRMIEDCFLAADVEVNIERIYQTFQRADREHRSTLSREQIKTLCYASQIPLSDSVLNQIIDRCSCSNGQYNWKQFIEFLERVQPSPTGLKIPESKKPKDFVKQFPEASSDWPRVGIEPAQPLSRKTQAEQSVYRSPRTESNAASPTVGAFSRQGDSRIQHQVQVPTQNSRGIVPEDKNLESAEEEPWIERFMNLASAMYRTDAANSGYLTVEEVSWLTREYNNNHRLGIPEPEIEKAIHASKAGGNKVALNPLLRILGTGGS